MRRIVTFLLTLLTMTNIQAQTLTDYHCHLITPEYRAALAKHDMLLDERFPLPQWSAESHLQLMDEAGISQSIFTHPFFGDQEEYNHLCRQFNEQTAAICRGNSALLLPLYCHCPMFRLPFERRSMPLIRWAPWE